MKVLFSSNLSWSIYNFRAKLLKELLNDDIEIFVVAKPDNYSSKLEELGFTFVPLNINNSSVNPLSDLKSIFSYLRIYRKIKPDLILHNAIKPNIYGTIAAGLLSIPTINNVSGLGTLFIQKSFATLVARFLYKVSQKFATIVFFQNSSDKFLFESKGLVNKKKSRLIPGSGVDTNIFVPSSVSNKKTFDFLLIARLLKDKGILEYYQAAKELKSKYQDQLTFNILGPYYNSNPTAISESQINAWQNDGVINYLGFSDDVQPFIANANCVVLPSYREGLSKVLIEASSMAKPIITTDVPGCKDVVIDQYNGFLCKVKDPNDLYEKMEKMFLLSNQEREVMGANARTRAVEYFDEKIVINKYKEEIKKIFSFKK